MSSGEKIPDSEEANRMWASASFVGVLIIIGLPLWWKTTEVYRVALPYDEIYAFDPLSHNIHTQLVIHAADLKTADDVATAVEKAFKDYDVIKLNITKSILSSSLQQTLESVADESEALEVLASTLDVENPNLFHVVQRKPLFKDVWLGSDRVMFFRDEKASSTVAKALDSWVYQPSILTGARAESPDQARRTRFPPAPDYSILLSVVHPTPGKMAVDFDARSSMEDYIGSFVDELSALHNFTLKSQWLHQLDFKFQANVVSTPSPHIPLRASSLPRLLSLVEERSASSASLHHAIRLVLYVAPCGEPWVIYDQSGNRNPSPLQAFISPKWGGVVFWSPSRQECALGVAAPHAGRVMGAFVAQLRVLLGITDREPIPGGHLEPLRSVIPRHWEVDGLMRIRTLELLTSAERTLQSLAKLLGEISNIVIDAPVGASLQQAVLAAASARLSHDVFAAATHAQRAHTLADHAFNAPRLLALLYFPDDQKYAIYIPLFLPIMFPVVLSLKNLFLWFRGKPIHKEKTE